MAYPLKDAKEGCLRSISGAWWGTPPDNDNCGRAWRCKLFRAARRRCRGPVRHLQRTEIGQPSTPVRPDRNKMAPVPTRAMSASASCGLIVILVVVAVLVLPRLAKQAQLSTSGAGTPTPIPTFPQRREGENREAVARLRKAT